MSEETSRGAPAKDPGPDDKGIPAEGVQPRGKWANNWESLLCMAAAIIGPGAVWLFPYMCFKNGGAAFLIPYIVLLVLCGIPLFFLETALGQYTSEGGVTAWRKICPMMEGVGFATQVILTYQNIYFIVILAWSLFYLLNSFQTPQPWFTCDHSWNTDACQSIVSMFLNSHLFDPDADWSFLNNVTTNYLAYFDDFSLLNATELSKSPATEFWLHRVLRVSDDMSMSTVHWDTALLLLLAWIICYFCVWQGIRSTGKVVYFTVTFPYLLLFIIFIRGVTLPGAAEGLSYYLRPDFSRLLYPYVWLDAAHMVLFTYGMCQGVLTSLGSYNKYNNNCYRDCLVLCCLNIVTSIFAGFAVFSVLGFLAEQMRLPVADIADAGIGLAFTVFPMALSMLPVSSFWAVLFFLLIFFLALDSHFIFVESLATTITDMFPRQLRRPWAREILALAIAGVCFLLGLPMVTEGGIVLFSLVDSYGCSSFTFFIIAIAETITVAWVYGADRFGDNIEDMLGYKPLVYPALKYSWMFITPLISGLVLLLQLSRLHSFSINGFVPGNWFYVLGTLLIIAPLMCIPVFILITLYKNGQNMTTPSSVLRQARPNKPILTMCQCVIFKAQGRPNRVVDDSSEKMMMEEPRV